MRETLVTGGRGFIGKHLTERLSEFRLVPHEEIDTTVFWPFTNLYFLSAYGNMSDQRDEAMTIKANVQDVIRVLGEVDWKEGFNSFVYMSSSSVKLKVQTLYSRTKSAAEQLLLAYAEKYNAPVCIVRPYSVTGVGEQSGHLIPTLIRAAYTGEEVPFVSHPRHDFIDVEDVVDAVTILSNAQAKGIFEVGTGISHTNQQVLEAVEQITGRKVNIKPTGYMRPYDNEDWVCRNNRLRDYGWFPKKTLLDSIQEMVNKYKHDRTRA